MKYLKKTIDLPLWMIKYLDMVVRMEVGSILSIKSPGSMFSLRGNILLKIGPKDTLELMAYNWLDVQHVIIYIKFLVEKFIPRQGAMSVDYRFLCPQTLSHVNVHDEEERKKIYGYVINTMRSNPISLIFLPFCFDYHWVLYVICPSLCMAWSFDSLGKKNRKWPKCVIDTVFKTYIGNNEGQHTTIDVKCPKQIDSVSCGYFVMRYMRDLISKQWKRCDEAFSKKETKAYTA